MIDVIRDAISQIRGLITPPRYLSWQTLLLLSLFSWLMATLAEVGGATPFTVTVLSTGSWLFLTVAIWWGLSLNPVMIGDISISPWITAAVICVFVFNPWTTERMQLAMGFWPVIATLLVAIPHFFHWNFDWTLPPASVRQDLIVLLLVNLLLSSWILFYFRVQHWFNDYPSLIAENLDNSAFVYRFGADTNNASQADLLLSSAATSLAQQLNDTPWPRVERWLLNLDNSIDSVADNIVLNAAKERVFWSLDAPRPQSISNGYQLRLRANWLGPTAKQNGYYAEKVCTILPRTLQPRGSAEGQPEQPEQPAPTPVAQVTCSEETTEVERSA
ncbi:MAG: DUF5357 family protein [Cyanobacteria bacterium P01_A01_bin.15]